METSPLALGGHDSGNAFARDFWPASEKASPARGVGLFILANHLRKDFDVKGVWKKIDGPDPVESESLFG